MFRLFHVQKLFCATVVGICCLAAFSDVVVREYGSEKSIAPGETAFGSVRAFEPGPYVATSPFAISFVANYECRYRFEWRGANGVMQKHAPTPWRPILLHGREPVELDAVSPVPDTDDFRLVIRRR